MNDVQKYYWLCSYPLKEGSIVSSGNWGRILSQYNQQNCHFGNVAREYIFEKVRLEKFPEKPSRLKSTFLCESLEKAKQFKQEANRVFDLIYEVEIIGNQSTIYRADWQLANFPQIFTIEIIEKQAEDYWNGNNITNAEILTENEIKVIRKL